MTKPFLLALLLCMVLLGGCIGGRVSPPVTLYTLETTVGDSVNFKESDISIGLHKVILADYLRQSNLLVRNSAYTLTMSNSHKWAGSLEDQLTTAIAVNVGKKVGTKQVFVAPAPTGMKPTHYLAVRILTFEGTDDGEAMLSAWWGIYGTSRTLLVSDVFNATEKADMSLGPFKGIVAAQSKLVRDLSDEIASRF